MPVWSHYLKLMGLNGDVNRRALCSAFSYYPRMRKLRYFVDCFAGVMMYGPFDGKAKPAERVFVYLANEWLLGICSKPWIKCGDCAHRQLIPVSDLIIYHYTV